MDVDVEEGDAVGVSWGARQTYRYEASDACYFRNVTGLGYTVVSDHSDEACVKGSPSGGVAELAAGARSGAAELVRLKPDCSEMVDFLCLFFPLLRLS